MAQKVSKLFTKPYLKVLEQANVIAELLSEDINLFTPQFPKINAAFLLDFEQKIASADNTPSDEEVVNEQQLKTLSVEQIMELSRRRMRRLLLYVGIAFEDNPLAKEVFGNRMFRKYQRYQIKMIEVLELAHQKAEDADYKQALIDEGFKQDRIDEIQTLADGLREADIEKESQKAERQIHTQARITRFNAFWKTLVKLSKAAKVVFEEDYAKRNQYKLYPGKVGKKKKGKVEGEKSEGLENKH